MEPINRLLLSIFLKKLSKKSEYLRTLYIVIQFEKLINIFYRKYPEKIITIFLFLNLALLMAKSTILSIKLKKKVITLLKYYIKKLRNNSRISKNDFKSFQLLYIKSWYKIT